MTRNAYVLLSLLFTTSAFATAESVPLQGMGGAGRGGVAKESLFSNPAGAAFLTESSGFLNYTKPGIKDFNAGGRGYSAGIYDGEQGDWKGAFGYVRSSRATMTSGRQTYEDRSDFRFTLARMVSESIALGAQVRYQKVRDGGPERKFFQGDVGTIFPVFQDVRLGVTYENISQRPGERPGTLGIGTQYPLGFGVQTFLDVTRIMAGSQKGDRGYNIGAQMGLIGGFMARGGKFQDAYRRLKGWSLGLGWNGPRANFDYAMRMTGTSKREKDHLFGMNFLF